MKDTYTIVELMKNPLNTNDVRKLKKLADDFNVKENKIAKLMKATCPFVIVLLAIISYSIFSKTANQFDLLPKVMFYGAAVVAVIAFGIVINLSIYAIYVEMKKPFRFTYKTEFRGGEDTESFNIYDSMFDEAKGFDLTTINSMELTKTFYEKITKEQNRQILDFEYEIVKHLHKKVS